MQLIQLLPLLSELLFRLIALLAELFALGNEDIKLMAQRLQICVSWWLRQCFYLLEELIEADRPLLRAEVAQFGD